MELHKVGMHGKFATATKRKIERGRYYRYGGVPQPHRGILISLYRHIDLIVVLFHGHHENQPDIGTGGKIGPIITYNKPAEVFFREVNRFVQPLDNITPYRIHFGMEFGIENAIAKVDDGKTTILPDGFFATNIIQYNKALRTWDGFI